MISGDGCGLRFPDICHTVEEKPRQNLNQENWQPGIEPVPARWEATMLHLDHSGGLDWSCWRQGPMAGFCKDGNEPPDIFLAN